MKDYLKIITKTKKIMTLSSFKKITGLLPASDFIRVHHSYIIAVNSISSIEKERIKIGEALIPVSRSYKEEFQNLVLKKLL
jgi:two-component system LytT family response regulator